VTVRTVIGAIAVTELDTWLAIVRRSRANRRATIVARLVIWLGIVQKHAVVAAMATTLT